jgi:SAM-dependent methyltransferase
MPSTAADAPRLAIPPEQLCTIEIWDEGLVGHADWRQLRDGIASEADPPRADYRRYLAEDHHRLYGRPWSIGRSYFEFLREQGLRPDHRVLDFGCGAGRIGIWLVPYLERGHYVGVDHHWMALDAFARYEVPLHGLAPCSPRLVLDGSLDVARLAARFDVILDCFVSYHLDQSDRIRLYRGFLQSLSPGGRIFLPHGPTLDPGQLAALGLRVVHAELRPSPFLVGYHPKDRDHWHVIARADDEPTAPG